MRLLIFAICSIIQLNIFAQNFETTISFNNENEKQLFHNYTKSNVFNLLYTIDNEKVDNNLTIATKQDFYNFLDQIKEDVFSKKRKKTAANLYKKIHTKYFNKYIENPIFSDIFTKKEYNCVTASALYALALEHYNIPYEIRETPVHVYLVLYPNEDKIIYESTTPGSNLMSISKKEIENYKQNLIANKIITEEEGKSDDFFDDYYLGDSTINVQQLAAIHYFNNGIKKAEANDFINAINQLEKGYQYHATEYIKELIKYYLVTHLDNIKADKSSVDYCNYYGKLAHYTTGIENYVDEVSALFYMNFSDDIKTEKDRNHLSEVTACLTPQIENDSLKDKITDINYAMMADYYLQSADFDKALQYVMKIYNPEKAVLNLAAKDCVLRKLSDIRNPEQGLDSLAKYIEIFPFLKEDKHALGFKAWCKLRIIHIHFELNEYEDGIAALNEFRKEFKPDADVVYSEDLLGAGFGSASAYFVRKNDYNEAKKLLLEGLEYNSFNLELKRKLKLLYENFPELKE